MEPNRRRPTLASVLIRVALAAVLVNGLRVVPIPDDLRATRAFRRGLDRSESEVRAARRRLAEPTTLGPEAGTRRLARVERNLDQARIEWRTYRRMYLPGVPDWLVRLGVLALDLREGGPVERPELGVVEWACVASLVLTPAAILGEAIARRRAWRRRGRGAPAGRGGAEGAVLA